MSGETRNLLVNTADIHRTLTRNWENFSVSIAKDLDFGPDYSLSFECESTADSDIQARFNYISTDGKHKLLSNTPSSAVSAGENQVTLLIPAFSRPDDFAKAYLMIQAMAIADDGAQLTISRPMLVEGTTPAAWAPAEGETLSGGGAQTSANLWSDSTASMQIRADGTYLAGKVSGELSSAVTGLSSLTENQTIHMGASLRGADAGVLKPFVEYKDAAGNKNWVGFPSWQPTDSWQRFEGTCVVPSGMTIYGVGFSNDATTGNTQVANPVFSYGSAVVLASSAHTPYATQDHLRSEYATKAALKVTSDAVTAEVTERGKLAGRVGTLESTSGTHTSKLEQLATSIKSLVKGESTYTDPDGKSATSGIYSLVTQTRDSVTALFGQYTKTADLASTQAVKDAKKAGTDAASAASAAQSTADTAKANAATAQSTADRAQSTADAALDNAGTANGRVRAVEARVSASIDGLDVRVRGVSEAVSAQGATVRDVERNMSFGLDGLVIGAADSASKVRITEKRETFEVDGKTVLALDGDTSTVEASALKIGGYVWTVTNGGKNLTLVYRG